MNNFFAVPTDEWGDDAVRLTPQGVLTVAAVVLVLIAAAILIRRFQSKNSSARITTRQLVFSAAAVALAMITSMLKFFDLPFGGSITLFSMLFITVIGYWYGPSVGIMTGMAYGLLQFLIEPIFYTIPQMLTDYPLAFGALGLAGFFWKQKHGLQIGYIAGVLGRYFFSFLSGVLFFASYAPDGMNPYVYSLAYNGIYLGVEAALTLLLLSIPAVSRAFQQIKRLATAQ